MRIKILVATMAVAAVAFGGVASAAFNSSVVVKAEGLVGKPLKVNMTIDHSDPAKVPPRVKQLVISSSTVKWNRSGAAVCTSPRTTDGTQVSPPCSAKTKVGTGSFEAYLGTVGQPPLPESDALNRGAGTVTLYNYTTSPGDKVTLLGEIKTTAPLPDVFITVLAHVKANGTITTDIPANADLPVSIQSIIGSRTVVLKNVNFKLNPVKPPRGKKPFASLKTNKKLDFTVQLVHE